MNLFAKLKNHILFKYYKIRKKNIPETNHITRYLKPSVIENDTVLSAGFQYKKGENCKANEKELSVNWLEFFNKKSSIQENLEKVRKVFSDKSYTLRKNGRFAVLNIKKMCDEVKEGTKEQTEVVSLITKHTPYKNDLSHSSIIGTFDTEGEFLVSTILASYANDTELFPAKLAS